MEDNKNFKKWIKIVFLGILLYWALFNLKTVGNIVSKVFSIIFPLILGIFIALILNIPMRFFEKKFKGKNKTRQVNILERVLALILSIIIIVLVISLVINLIVPEFVKMVKLIINNIPYYGVKLNNLFNRLQVNHPEFNLKNLQLDVNNNLEIAREQLINNLPNLVTSSIKMVRGLFSGITQFVIALVFAFYILLGKDNLKKQSVRFAHTYLKDKSEIVIKIINLLINNFENFVGAQCVEALILGILCTIGLLILRIPYAVTIGVVVGVTALIPIVGALVGMAIGVILIVSVSPIKVIIFIVFLLILQQIENNVIYPKVVGNKIGLPGIWVLLSITIGGSLLGVIGMLLAIPIGATIHCLVNEKMDKNDKKNS